MNPRFYGLFDPVSESIEHIAPCAQCQNNKATCVFDIPKTCQLPGLVDKQQQQLYRRAYFIECPNCHSRGLASKKQWQAVIEWNKSPKALKIALDQFPLFGLSELNKAQAKDKLQQIRSDLEQRKKERLNQGNRLHNSHYEKIRAFLAWSIYAQTVVKLSK